MPDLAAFVFALTADVVLGSGVFIVFCILRPYRALYTSRMRIKGEHRPKKPPNGFVNWIPWILRLTDDEMYRSAGMDALMFTSTMWFGFECFLFCSVIGLLILIPVNREAGNTETVTVDGNTTEVPVEGIDTLTLTNVPEESRRLWAHWVALHLFVFVVLWRAKILYAKYVKYRRRFLAEGRRNQYTIMIVDLDVPFQNSDVLREKFEELYPGEVVSANVVQSEGALLAAVTARDNAVSKLENVQGKLFREPDKERPVVKSGVYGCREESDAEIYWKDQVGQLNEQVATLQDEQKANPKYLSVGFVSFSNLSTASAAAQCINVVRDGWKVLPAPEKRDLFWFNVKMDPRIRMVNEVLWKAATYALLVFYIIPVSLVASLTTLEALSERLPFLEGLTDENPALKGFLQGFLPTLALLLFIIILPFVLTLISILQGFRTHTEIEERVIAKHYLFQVQIFFVSIIAGSLFDSLDQFIDSPTSIVTLLGESIPRTGLFFTTYVLLLGLVGHPMRLLNIGALLVMELKVKFLVQTKREMEEALKPPPFQYGWFVPVQLMIFMVGLCYSTVSPLILFFVTYFYFMGYITYRYNLYCVNEQESEGGGYSFPTMFNRLMLGIALQLVVMVGIFGVKKAVLQAPMLIPLIYVVYRFWKYTIATSERVMYLSQEDAVAADHKNMEDGMTVQANEFLQDALKAPRHKLPNAPTTKEQDKEATKAVTEAEGDGEAESQDHRDNTSQPNKKFLDISMDSIALDDSLVSIV